MTTVWLWVGGRSWLPLRVRVMALLAVVRAMKRDLDRQERAA